jgi:hypothetical protein
MTDKTMVALVEAKDKRMSTDDKLNAIMQKLIEIDINVAELRSTLVSTFNDEFSPKRKEMSNLLAAKVRQRMKGEFLAREATAPTGAWWCQVCLTAHPQGYKCEEIA